MSTQTHTESDSDKSALQHAQDLHRSSLKVFLVFFVIALGAFWAAISEWGFVWRWIGMFAILVGFVSGIAGFISGVRVFQLSKEKS